MGRIRSIKPDFFTSETIAQLPISARLTFIGLWTYVDDNGVGRDNPTLVTAALYPLDSDDPLETFQRVAQDLEDLAALGLIQRYQVGGRRLMFVTSWDEHQRVQHPGKPRYPRPLTSTDEQSGQSSGDPPEILMRISGEPHEDLTPEQGAGSREQGAGNRLARPDERDDPQLTLVEASTSRQTARPRASSRLPPKQVEALFGEFYATYPRHEGRQAARKAWDKAITQATPEAIIAGARRFATDPNLPEKRWIPHPQTWLNRGSWDDDPLPARDDNGGRPRVAAGNEDHWASGGGFGMPP